jgi:hypothetical protein
MKVQLYYSLHFQSTPSLHRFLLAGQTDIRDVPNDGASSFLERERAALGDDADFFVSDGDNLAPVQSAGGDDLLGGGDYPTDGAKDELSGFESSFPAIDTTNEVWIGNGMRRCIRICIYSKRCVKD